MNIADLTPENPQTNDQVLLQDIYEQIDLDSSRWTRTNPFRS